MQDFRLDYIKGFRCNAKAIIFGIIVILIIIALDQISKDAALDFTRISLKVEINKYLNFVHVWNKGISFGLFNQFKNSSYIFLSISSIITFILIFWLMQSGKFATYFPLSLVIGGAISNIIDRIRHGAVVDFIELHIETYFWPAFNLADSFICIGVFFLIIDSVFEEVERKKNA